MKRNILYTLQLLAFIFITTSLGGCNNEDDVIDIFTGKTWKLTFIAAADDSNKGDDKQFDFWGGNQTLRANSMKARAQSGNFILEFVGIELTNINGGGGEFEGHGVLANVSGSWTANGKSNDLVLGSLKFTRNETDVLAKAFVTGLKNAFRYEGDNQNLYIYYTENGNVKFMAFRPAK